MKNIKVFLSVCVALAAWSLPVQAQKYFTRDGKVSFEASTPLERIEGYNSKASSVLDLSTQAVEFAVLVKAFAFEKKLMQDHFNENYLESDKYPKATFKGRITDPAKLDLSKNGQFKAKVSGDLSIHGATKPVSTVATFTIRDGKINATSEFVVKVADYNIEIPSVVSDKVAKEARIKVNVDYQALETK